MKPATLKLLLQSLLFAVIVTAVVAALWLLATPKVMDMDGHVHIMAGIFGVFPFTFIATFLIRFIVLYRAENNVSGLKKRGKTILLSLGVIVALILGVRLLQSTLVPAVDPTAEDSRKLDKLRKTTTPDLVRRLENYQSDVGQVAKELGRRKAVDAVPALIKCMNKHDDDDCAQALGAIGDASAVQPLTGKMESGSRGVDAERALINMGDKAVPGLLKMARSPGLRKKKNYEDFHHRLLTVLSHSGKPDALKYIGRYYVDQASQSEVYNMRPLLERQGKSALPYFLAAMKAKDWWRRKSPVWGIRMLVIRNAMTRTKAVQHIEVLLDDPHAAVREEAVRVLGILDATGSLPRLRSTLAKEKNRQARQRLEKVIRYLQSLKRKSEKSAPVKQ